MSTAHHATGAHRQNYTPTRAISRSVSRRFLITAAIVAASIGAWALALLIKAPSTRPVHTPALHVAAASEQQLAEIRIRAWRAGYQSALQGNCPRVMGMPVLGTIDQ